MRRWQYLPTRGNWFTRGVGKLMLRIAGWRIQGRIPDIPKMVVIVAPHTSNWDFYYGVAAKLALGVKVKWLGKHSLFRFPIKKLLLWLGGIPVDRRVSSGVVEAVVKSIENSDRFILGLAPEGTRKRQPHWKSGFYYIALKANIPILLASLDYGSRSVVLGPLIHPTGDYQKDIESIKKFFMDKIPRKKDQFALPEGKQ